MDGGGDRDGIPPPPPHPTVLVVVVVVGDQGCVGVGGGGGSTGAPQSPFPVSDPPLPNGRGTEDPTPWCEPSLEEWFCESAPHGQNFSGGILQWGMACAARNTNLARGLPIEGME